MTRRLSATFVSSRLALLARSDLLDLLLPFMGGHTLGRCILAKTGEVLTSHRSVYTRVDRAVFLRAGRGSVYHHCEFCGQPVLEFSGEDPDSDHVLRSQLDERRVYQCGTHGGLMLTPDLHAEIDWSRFPDVEFFEYPVREQPLDDGRGERLPIV